MTTWILGDVRGRASLLAELIAHLEPGPDDLLVATGNLLHGGRCDERDPLGVIAVAQAYGLRFVVGSHEHAVLDRLSLAPGGASEAGPGRLPSIPPPLVAGDLVGDEWASLDIEDTDCDDVLDFLLGHRSYVVDSRREAYAATTDGRDWCVVHATVPRGRTAEDCPGASLVQLPRASSRGARCWTAGLRGERVVVHGHAQEAAPRRILRGGRLAAVGLGVAQGLVAYAPELDRFEAVEAAAPVRVDAAA